MKQLVFLFAAFFISSIVRSQCEVPEIIDWTAVDDSTFNITFESPLETSYKLDLRLEYADEISTTEVSTSFGDAQLGTNTITVAILEGEVNTTGSLGVLYFTAYLSLECEDGVYSDSSRTYLSAHSLAGESGFNCDSLYRLFEPLPDLNGVPFEAYFTVPDNGEVIESLSVFVDIGHTFNGDLSISLTHPNGTNVVLLDNGLANGLTSSWGFSVIFTDETVNTILGDSLGSGAGPKGIYQATDSLSVLIGEPLAGEWKLTVIDNLGVDDGMLFGACLTLNGIPCIASVEGTAFYDFNDNGVQNELEPGFPYANILNSISGDQFFSDNDGEFWNCTEGGSGTLELLNAPPYYESSPVDVTISADDQLTGVLFPIVATEEISDISVDLVSLDPNRPGFEADYLAQINNIGTICEDGVSFDLTFPNYVEITGSENPDLVISDNTASLNVGAQVCPFTPFELVLTILIDDTVSLGTMLEATVSANVSDDDPNELNNTFTSVVEVVGSYDPNDKQVSAEMIGDDFLEAESPLKYTVRFQNTGTFYAERVLITDTIDADLDINSLNITSTSHDMQLSREGNVVYFEFDQIFLPDSATDLEGSNGHVRYEITPLSTFGEGDLIDNTAYIYFDFNEPIITNTVTTIFQNPLSVSDQGFDVGVYPNPTEGLLHVRWADDVSVGRVEVYDISGRTVFRQNVTNGNMAVLDINGFTDGLYLLNVVSGNRESRVKIVKTGKR